MDMTTSTVGYPDTQLLIDGTWRPGASGLTIPVVNPATEATIGTVAQATREDLDAALAAADKGFAVWSDTSAYERSKIMRRAADLLRERKDKIAWLMTREQGKPLAAVAWRDGRRRRHDRLVCRGSAPHLRPDRAVARATGVSADASSSFRSARSPPSRPWNFPINQIVRKLSAALATGCSIIVKAPEETPASPAETDPRLRRCRRSGRGHRPGVRRSGRDFRISHPASDHPQDFLHRLDADRQAAGRACRAAHEARHDGTRRPCAGHRLRRCRYRQGRRRCWRWRSSAMPARSASRRPASSCRKACSSLRRRLRRSRQGHQGRQRPRRRRHDGAACQRTPHPGAGSADRRMPCRQGRRAAGPAAGASATRATSSSRPC